LRPQKQTTVIRIILLIVRVGLLLENLNQGNYLSALGLSLSCTDNLLSFYANKRKKKRKKATNEK